MESKSYYNALKMAGGITRLICIILLIIIFLIQFGVLEFSSNYYFEKESIFWNIMIIFILLVIIVAVVLVTVANYNLKLIEKNNKVS